MILRRSSGLARTDLFAYGALALPLAFSGLPIYVYAPDFYTTYHGVPLALMGTVLLLIRLLDAVQDPVIGIVSDRWHHRRLAIIGSGLALLAVSFVMLYNPPAGVAALPWFAASMIGTAFAFSIVSINYNALGSLWSDKAWQKTAIVAAREGIGLAGLLIATLAPAFLQLEFSVTRSYRIYAVLFAVASLISFIFFRRWSRRCAVTTSFPAAPDQRGIQWGALVRRPFGPLFLVYGLSSLASAIPGVLVIFFIRDRLQAGNLIGIFLAIYFISGIAGMPLWKAAAERIGNGRAWIAAMMTGAICFIGAYWLRSGDIFAYGAICFLSGVALGGELILPLAIASDMIDDTRQHARTAAIFSVLLFIGKLALALASGGAFALLSRSGYRPGSVPSVPAAAMLSLVYALIPSGIKLASVVIAMLSPSLHKK